MKNSTQFFRSLRLAAFGVAIFITGCSGATWNSVDSGSSGGTGSNPTGTSGGSSGGGPTGAGASAQVTGKVLSGQQPVSGASIQLYTVGTAGLKSASAPLLTSPVTTGADGSFSIAGAFSCTGGSDVYLVASGGNAGTGSANAAISEVAALGSCADLLANDASTVADVNEVTTVAAAFALAPFATDSAHVGASGVAPVGIAGAFVNAALLANVATGAAGGATLANGVAVPVSEINTLADILASCTGSSGPSSTQCTALFSATGASDSFGAALAIAKNPGAAAITGLYKLVSQGAPFQPSLTAAPGDFTVSVTMAGASGTLATPYGLAIDAGGNAWVTNESDSSVVAFSPSGSYTTARAAGLVGAQAIAVDRNSNVWVANTAGNSVVEFTPSSGFVPGSGSVSVAGTFTSGGIDGPSAIAIDPSGDVWVANYNGGSVTALSNSGVPLANSPFMGSNSEITVPTAIAVDKTGTVYVTSGSVPIVKMSNSGAVLGTLSDGQLLGAVSVAIDPATNDLFVTGYTAGTSIGSGLSEFTGASSPAADSPVTAGISSPAGVAFDGTSIWVANSVSTGSLAQFTYAASSPLSPAAGFGSLNTPVGIAIDPSGSVWTTNSGDNTVSKFIGLAAPVTTPLVAELAVD